VQCCGELAAEVAHEGVKVDVFDGQRVGVVAVELAAAFGSSDPGRLGGLVAGASMPADFDEGLDECRLIAVALLPVGAQAGGDGAEEVGGEVRDAHPGGDQEAGVADDELKAGLAGLCAPADPVVAVFERPGGSGEADRGDGRLGAGGDQVAQLGARRWGVAEVVETADHLVGHDRRRALLRADGDGDVFELAQPTGDGRSRLDRGVEVAVWPGGGDGSARAA